MSPWDWGSSGRKAHLGLPAVVPVPAVAAGFVFASCHHCRAASAACAVFAERLQTCLFKNRHCGEPNIDVLPVYNSLVWNQHNFTLEKKHYFSCSFLVKSFCFGLNPCLVGRKEKLVGVPHIKLVRDKLSSLISSWNKTPKSGDYLWIVFPLKMANIWLFGRVWTPFMLRVETSRQTVCAQCM